MWIYYPIILIILLAAELVFFRVAKHYSIIDRPTSRSSHDTFVLRAGGVIYIVGMWLYAAFFGLKLWPFLLGLTLVAIISFIDDVRSLPALVRLACHSLAILLVFYCWGVLSWENWWMIILGMILCVGIVNAYNFMDGINGLNGGYTFAVLLPLAWLNHQMGFVDQRLIIVALIANLVFCFFNYRRKGKAKCFAGDVGSVGAAFIVVFVLGLLVLQTRDFTYIVFLAVYGVDSLLTIIHRILLHEKIGVAHRKHAYQIMTNELGMEHVLVSTIYMVLQFAISFGMILIPNTPRWHWGYLIGVCLILGIAYVLFMKKYYHLHAEYLESIK